MVYGTTFQGFATGIVPLIRNNGGASFAMVTMITGFGMNIVLDYLFVWVLQLGMAGAAWASILGQAVTMVGSFVYVWKEKLPVLGVWKKGLQNRADRHRTVWTVAFSDDLPAVHEPFLSVLWRGNCGCELCLHRLWIDDRISADAGRGGWKPATDEPALR